MCYTKGNLKTYTCMCINKINQYYNWLIFIHKLNNILKDAAKGTAISIPIRPKAFPPIIGKHRKDCM